MRHRKRTVKLSRTSSHTKAMLRNMVCSLIEHGSIKTSKAKAKAARHLADKVIHSAVTGNGTSARRRVFQLLGSKEAVKRLFDEVAGRFSKTSGGYTKIVPFGSKKGDNTEMVFFALAYDVAEKPKSASTMKYHFKKKKKTRKKKKSSGPETSKVPEKKEPGEQEEQEEQENKEEETAEPQEKSGESD